MEEAESDLCGEGGGGRGEVALGRGGRRRAAAVHGGGGEGLGGGERGGGGTRRHRGRWQRNSEMKNRQLVQAPLAPRTVIMRIAIIIRIESLFIILFDMGTDSNTKCISSTAIICVVVSGISKGVIYPHGPSRRSDGSWTQ